MGLLDITETTKKIWDAWNIRGIILLSLFLQGYLIVMAPLRKGKWGKNWFVSWSIWLAYLSADWVGTYSIGNIFSTVDSETGTKPDDGNIILVFWAPFFLLHLGGPDTITSYALEDNHFWVRHLLGLILQVGFTLYIFLKSFSKNELWLPTILVLFAGIIKYVERNIALYLASLENLGEDWEDDPNSVSGPGIPIPKQFRDLKKRPGASTSILGTTVQLFGILKRLLVGPLLDYNEQEEIRNNFVKIRDRDGDVLKVLEIELSLLYEVLHTKLPVIASMHAFYYRLANLGCIFAAFIFFSVAGQRHYQLSPFDVSLTYALLVGAITLDWMSIWLLIKNSDWFAISRFQDVPKVIHRSRWSNTVSQSNILTYHVRSYPAWSRKLVEFPYLRIMFKAMLDSRCGSSLDFNEHRVWSFIEEEVCEFFGEEPPIQQVWLLKRGIKYLKNSERDIFENLDYTGSLLVWHIASELCFQDDVHGYPLKPEQRDYKAMCKLLSGYMFSLAVTQSQLMSTMLDFWKKEYGDVMKEVASLSPNFFSNERTVSYRIMEHNFGMGEDGSVSKLWDGVRLAKSLKDRKNGYPWKVMSQIWVQFMCHAAINCKPEVHAQQPSQGGELLTFVWLLMNHLGLGPKYYSTLVNVVGRELDGEEEDT